jgi:hypothetical protein
VRQQIDGDAAAHARELFYDMSPEVAVQENAVNEERGWARALFRISDVAERGGHMANLAGGRQGGLLFKMCQVCFLWYD